MTDEHSEQPQAQELGAAQLDWFLQILVNMTNAGDGSAEIGITLVVSGFLVSGKMIGGAKYFEGVAKDFASGFTDQTVAENIRTSFSQFGEIYRTDAVQQDAADQPLPSPAYVHLKEARFFNTAGNPIPANHGIWWRGRLSEVSGFVLGTIEPRPG
jgi:hypothetical protein